MSTRKQEFTENLGLEYLKRLDKKSNSKRIDNKTYILDRDERSNIFRIARKTIMNAFFVGVFSSAITSFLIYKLLPRFNSINEIFSKEHLISLIIMGVSILFISIIEMVILFFDTLNKTHLLTKAAHLELFPDNEKDLHIATSIARAALELPNPKNSDININPRKESIKIKIILTGIIYKLKVSFTNFMFKLFFKNTVGKALSRLYLQMLSIPVISFWNSFEAWKVVSEVKIRILGPSAVSEFVQNYRIIKKNISYSAELQILRATASCIITTEDLHPNLEYLYKTLKDEFAINTRNSTIDDTSMFLKRLTELTENEQKFILYVLEFAAIIDGKITKKEKQLLEAAFTICGFGFRYYKTRESLNKFKKGEIINWADKSLSNIY